MTATAQATVLEEFAAVVGDRGSRYAVVVDAGVTLAGAFGDLQDPGLVNVQDHAAAPGCGWA
ncbi:hypothetical protein AB0D86_27210 [Streptomyces sp. NPDC048324]|uniref:hypothetical protein n=1 Tax=Streptomyces sp. NPDC048324 TaxID=3157205 RepID=UPI00342CBB42